MAAQQVPLSQPSFVFINTDQQRWDTLGCYGSDVARTPNLDQLAAEGVRFTRCYTTNPVCMPARASWFTGQYPSHHGVWQNGVPLSQRADLIQHRLKDAGYHTGLIGKIHLDNVWLRHEPHPSYGFDVLHECEGDPYCRDEYFLWLEAQGKYDGYMAQFKAEGHCRGYTRDLPEHLHMNTWIVDHTGDYLAARAADRQPFFLSVGFFDPHHPFDPCEPYAGMFKPADMPMPIYHESEAEGMLPHARAKREKEAGHNRDPEAIRGTIAAYHATISHVDHCVGRIMALLRQHDLEQNTVVVFTSDHGELLGDHGLLHKGAFFYDCSIRVPLIWRFPKRFGIRGVDDGLTSHVDFAATVATLAGIHGPACQQGQPLFDRDLKCRPIPAPEAVVTEWRERRLGSTEPFQAIKALTTRDWKYVYHHDQSFGELYDLHNDPHELCNLWASPAHMERRKHLHEQLLAWLVEHEPCPTRTDIF